MFASVSPGETRTPHPPLRGLTGTSRGIWLSHISLSSFKTRVANSICESGAGPSKPGEIASAQNTRHSSRPTGLGMCTSTRSSPFANVRQRGYLPVVETHPDHPIPLEHGKILQVAKLEFVRGRVDQRRDVEALAGAVDPPPVVGALQVLPADPALAQVVALVWAGAPRGEQRAVFEPRQRQALSQQGHADDRTGRKICRITCRLPRAPQRDKRGVFGKRGGFMVLCGKGRVQCDVIVIPQRFRSRLSWRWGRNRICESGNTVVSS